MNEHTEMAGGQFLVYQTQDGKLKIDVRFDEETVWLSQQQMAALFQSTKQNVSLHIQKIVSEGELAEDSVVKDYLTTATNGKGIRSSSTISRGARTEREERGRYCFSDTSVNGQKVASGTSGRPRFPVSPNGLRDHHASIT